MKNLRNNQAESGVRMDRRCLKTQKAIKNALVELMSEKDISQITVKELAQRADINRKTFYTHYTSIYDVSGEIENEMIQNLKRLIQESCIASRDFATYSVFKALNDLIYQDFFLILRHRLDEFFFIFVKRIPSKQQNTLHALAHFAFPWRSMPLCILFALAILVPGLSASFTNARFF